MKYGFDNPKYWERDFETEVRRFKIRARVFFMDEPDEERRAQEVRVYGSWSVDCGKSLEDFTNDLEETFDDIIEVYAIPEEVVTSMLDKEGCRWIVKDGNWKKLEPATFDVITGFASA